MIATEQELTTDFKDELIAEFRKAIEENVTNYSELSQQQEEQLEEQFNSFIEILEKIELNLAEINVQVTEMNTHVNETFPLFFDTSRLIATYGFVYVPLGVIIFALWWFFKQFIHKY